MIPPAAITAPVFIMNKGDALRLAECDFRRRRYRPNHPQLKQSPGYQTSYIQHHRLLRVRMHENSIEKRCSKVEENKKGNINYTLAGSRACRAKGDRHRLELLRVLLGADRPLLIREVEAAANINLPTLYNAIAYHLRQLKKQKLVRITPLNRNFYTYEITETGKKFLEAHANGE